MSLKIELNGQLINGRIDGTENFEITESLDRVEKTVLKRFSSELTFYDDGFDIIKTELIDPANGFFNTVEVRVFDDCCGGDPVFVGVIRGDSIDWCEPGCFVSANLTEEPEALNCVKSTLIYDDHNGFATNRAHPAVRYCVEPRPAFIQIALIFIYFVLDLILIAILIPLIAVIFVIFSIVFAICLVIALILLIIPGVDPPDCTGGFTNPVNVINEILEVYDNLQNLLIQCGRVHPSPYAREYIKNVCDKCGLQFQSSILNDPSSIYYNVAFFSAEVQKGRAPDTTNFSLIGKNVPLYTLEQFLNEILNPTFNGDWRIVGNTLIFEREDFFSAGPVWINTVELDNQGLLIDSEVCFNWIDDERPAFGRFEYAKDPQEYLGAEAFNRYNDLIDWNVPPDPSQSGESTTILQVGAARFRSDGVELDVLDFFADFLGGAVNAIFAGAFSESEKYLLMSQHTAYLPKLLLLKDSTPNDNNLTENFYSDSYTGSPVVVPGESNVDVIDQDQRFNLPLWFNEGVISSGYSTNIDGTLYGNFHAIKNPRLPGQQNFEFNFAFAFDCFQYNEFSLEKSVELMKGGNIVNGIPLEVVWNFNQRTAKVSGIV